MDRFADLTDLLRTLDIETILTGGGLGQYRTLVGEWIRRYEQEPYVRQFVSSFFEIRAVGGRRVIFETTVDGQAEAVLAEYYLDTDPRTGFGTLTSRDL